MHRSNMGLSHFLLDFIVYMSYNKGGNHTQNIKKEYW